MSSCGRTYLLHAPMFISVCSKGFGKLKDYLILLTFVVSLHQVENFRLKGEKLKTRDKKRVFITQSHSGVFGILNPFRSECSGKLFFVS